MYCIVKNIGNASKHTMPCIMLLIVTSVKSTNIDTMN